MEIREHGAPPQQRIRGFPEIPTPNGHGIPDTRRKSAALRSWVGRGPEQLESEERVAAGATVDGRDHLVPGSVHDPPREVCEIRDLQPSERQGRDVGEPAQGIGHRRRDLAGTRREDPQHTAGHLP